MRRVAGSPPEISWWSTDGACKSLPASNLLSSFLLTTSGTPARILCTNKPLSKTRMPLPLPSGVCGGGGRVLSRPRGSSRSILRYPSNLHIHEP